MRNAISNFSKTMLIISSIFIAILLVSTVTAVPQVHGSIVSKRIEKVRKHVVFPNLVDLKWKDLADRVKENLQLLTQKINDKLKNLMVGQDLSREEKEKIASKILVFLDEVLRNKNNLRSFTLFNEIKGKLSKGETSAVPEARSLLQAILQYLDKYSKDVNGELSKIVNKVKDDAEKLFYLLDGLKSSGKEKLMKSLENILLHYNSEMFSKIKNLANGNWTKIILLILAIVAILIVIGILIFLLPFLAPLIQLFLMALTPLLALLAIAIIAGGILGLALIIIGLIILLIAFIVGLNLAMAIIFAIIILVIIAIIILSIALTALGLFIAAMGCIIGGIIAASPILLPILLIILSIALVINIVLGGTILATIYGLLERFAPSIAESIRSLCETLYNIPILGSILAFLLPGLPWPGTEHKKFLLPRLTILVTFLMQKMMGKSFPKMYSTV
ncbi:MAG: hypothetical protein J7J89_01520 [Thermoplasmata archaeon]|nr:hypothetical protein [Thermoplasmata archaeon]